jgi:UDP-N-acetylglucosamine 2-epimerase (non-hydrolysing)
MLSNTSNIYLIEPQDYLSFTYLLQRCYLIITDSGGIQEEATSLGKAVLLIRDRTERPEAVTAGNVKLVGTDVRTIVQQANELLEDENLYRAMAKPTNAFGDGHAASRIAKYIELLKDTQVLSCKSAVID